MISIDNIMTHCRPRQESNVHRPSGAQRCPLQDNGRRKAELAAEVHMTPKSKVAGATQHGFHNNERQDFASKTVVLSDLRASRKLNGCRIRQARIDLLFQLRHGLLQASLLILVHLADSVYLLHTHSAEGHLGCKIWQFCLGVFID